MKVKKGITLAQVIEAAKTAGAEEPTVFWSGQTGWWTDDPNDLGAMPNTTLPCCAFGSVLYQGDIKILLSAAVNNASHYGKHGLNKFMAMHHKNIEVQPGDALKLYGQVDIFEKALDEELLTNPEFSLL